MRHRKRLRSAARSGFGIIGLAFLVLGIGYPAVPAALGQMAKPGVSSQGVPQQEANEINQSQVPQPQKSAKGEEKVRPAFKNIKDETATYVFLGWIWASIFVLIYFLRQKIKEVDRLYKSRFFNPPRPPQGDSPSRP